MSPDTASAATWAASGATRSGWRSSACLARPGAPRRERRGYVGIGGVQRAVRGGEAGRLLGGRSGRAGGTGLGGAFLLGEVARRRVNLAAADALVFDVAADRLAGEAGPRREALLPAVTLVGLPCDVEPGSDTKGTLLLGIEGGVSKRVQKLGHGLLLSHVVRMPHPCGQHKDSIPLDS